MNTPMPHSDELIEGAISAGQTRLQQAIETHRVAVKKMAAITGADILAAFNALLEENPLVKALIWDQYTDYWNDGEECTFRLHGETYNGHPGWARSTLPDLSLFSKRCAWRDGRGENADDMLMRAPEEWEWIVGRAPTAEEVAAVNATVKQGPWPGFNPDKYEQRYDNLYEYDDPGFGIYTETIKTPKGLPVTDKGRRSSYEYDNYDYSWIHHKEVPGAEEQVKAVQDFVRSIPLALLQRTFGDHTSVFVWSGGIAVRHVDHE